MKPIAITLVFLSAGLLRAEIKTQEKSQMQFPGMLGRMMNLFGGKSMREGVVDTVAVKGNRKITINDMTGRIVDLDEEKVYDLDMKAKKYKVMTFDELRQQMEQAQQRAKNEQEKTQPSTASKSEPNSNAKQMQIDFDLKETGQKKNINGFDCREVVMTITVREKDKTLEQSGGMVMTTHQWLTPRIAAMKEITDFDSRYAEKLRGPSFAIMPSADQMAAAAAMYPMLTDAIGYAYQEAGHTFYVLRFPSAQVTWVYDAATGVWHKRGFWNGSSYVSHLSQCHAYAFGQHLVGDWSSGNIYSQSISNLSDNTSPIVRTRIAPTISNESTWMTFQQLQIDVETGLGPMPPLLDGNGNPRGPQMLISWSDDNAHTWSNEHAINCGQAGNYKMRAIIRRLGRSRNRTFKVTMSDPIAWRITDAYLIATGFEPTERIVKRFVKMA